MLFSLPLLLIIQEIDKLCNLLLNVWYLDDGTLIGPPIEVAKAFEIIKNLGPKLGLHLNQEKCELFWPTEGYLSFSAKYQEAFPLFPDIIQRRCAPFTDLLGSPILAPGMKKGDLCFVEIEKFLNGRVEKIRKIHNALPSLQDAQSQYVLLGSCLLMWEE